MRLETRYRKIHIDYRSKILYRFILTISIIYGYTTTYIYTWLKLMQNTHNSTVELHLFCIKPLIMTDITFFSSKLLSVYLWVQPWCLEEAQCQVRQVCLSAWRDQHSGRCYPWQGLPQNWSRTAEEIENGIKKKKKTTRENICFGSGVSSFQLLQLKLQ